MITMRHKMEGYINSGFNNSLSTFSLKTQSFLNSKDEPEHPIDTKTKVIPTTETDLDNDSFLSDLEKNSTRGFPEHDSDLPVLHGYCDRSFEKDILTFTNGDTGTVGQRTPETTDNDGVNVNGRQGNTISICDSRVAAPSLASQRLKGGARFTPRPAPPPIPEEADDQIISRTGDGRISMRLSNSATPKHKSSHNNSANKKRKPEPKISNLFGLIDTEKLNSLLGSRQPSSIEDRLMTGVCSGEVTSETYHPSNQPPPVSMATPSPLSSRMTGGDMASIAGLVSLILLVISHASPAWLESWQDTNSPFTRMGPWQMCFNRFRFPHLQFDELFHGCHSMWGHTYRQIREWLMPPWLLVIQAFLILCLILSIISRLISIAVVFQSPKAVWLRFGYHIILITVFLDLITGIILFILSLVFAFSCWSRSWLLYPNWNYLSWGWASILLSSWSHLVSAALFLAEARQERSKKVDNEDLLFQLESGPIFSTHNSGVI